MRIAYFTNTYPRATDTFIQREVIGLRERGFDVRTFSVRRSGVDHDVGPDVLAEKRSTLYLLPVNPALHLLRNLAVLLRTPGRYLAVLKLAVRTARPGIRGALYQLFYFQEAVALAAELRKCNIEHLHAHLGDISGTVALLASKLTGIGYSITVHGSDVFLDPTHWALREKVKHSRFVICISSFCKSQMMLFSDQTDWRRLRIVHCGVDFRQYEFAKPSRTAKRLLYIGRLAVEKGIPVLFESLNLLRRQGYEFELALVGDGVDRDMLSALAKELDLSDRVVFAGFASQDEVGNHLQQSDVFVLPSFLEGVPVSLMEAMACGVPVIATSVGGVTELVTHGETGQVVFPGDSVGLRDAIARYLDDEEFRCNVTRQARQKVLADFNLQTEVDRLADLFLREAMPPSTS